MYDTILVPTDGSAEAEAALEHAIDHASRYDAELQAMYVVQTNDQSVALEDALREEGKRALDDAIELADAADVTAVERVLGQGVAQEAILDHVDENDVDLVVMGTQGRTGLDRYLVGSVTETVVRHCDVPVLTVSNRDG
jgi:nucleotide-binding universal stress UspA family protein